MTIEQLVTAGGTAGLIGFLLYVVIQFGTGAWHSRSSMEACEKRTTEANTRTEAALTSGTRATSAVEGLTAELTAYRTLVERLLTERQGGGTSR